MAPKSAFDNGKPERARFRTGARVVKRARMAKSGRRAARPPPPPPQRPRDPDLMCQFESQDIPVFTPGDLEYERAVACSNLLYRFSRPTYVVQPRENLHVQTVVMEAKNRRLPIAIKNGGHSYSGASFPSDGIMLDLKNMNGVKFDKYVFENCRTGWGDQHSPLMAFYGSWSIFFFGLKTSSSLCHAKKRQGRNDNDRTGRRPMGKRV